MYSQDITKMRRSTIILWNTENIFKFFWCEIIFLINLCITLKAKWMCFFYRVFFNYWKQEKRKYLNITTGGYEVQNVKTSNSNRPETRNKDSLFKTNELMLTHLFLLVINFMLGPKNATHIFRPISYQFWLMENTQMKQWNNRELLC